MSDETEKLKGLLGFTPQSAGIDRDAIIFAAGRAAANRSRHWKYIASLLAGTQALTLALLMVPAKVPQGTVAPVNTSNQELVKGQTELPIPDPSAFWVLHQHASDGTVEATNFTADSVSSEAPLSMRSRPEQIQ
ncbi:hypothetical protein KIH39_25675 [Telmatocola sphagniphila]|uniref:Uncharacterized protein n=1 Tax=Telmatocola sphagniphila TaxID=1123043 RepID=A0A8E6EV29_9BACT|nr:hypothetical protein [Telmatocola sphagniphila]QVL32185.1 hypothetical protein KIH39_25675 [Telmatocola sphagniphila]